jgi:ABC-type uncharacterized transport system permease subunit
VSIHWSLLALFLSYRILDIADLTTDGCFILGMAVSVSLAAAGHPFLGIFAGIAAGGCAGYVTAFLQTRLGVPSILAGIITNTGLYTVNSSGNGMELQCLSVKGRYDLYIISSRRASAEPGIKLFWPVELP